MEVIMRMLRMEAVQKEVLDDIERTLRTEFMSNLARTQRRDSHEMMADIFNNLDRNTENRFMTALEERNRESAERIKKLMFTFDDLIRVDDAGIQILLRQVDKDQLAMALKGGSEEVRDLFFCNMSERAGKMMREDMEAMGPVRAQAMSTRLRPSSSPRPRRSQTPAKSSSSEATATVRKRWSDGPGWTGAPRKNSCSTAISMRTFWSAGNRGRADGRATGDAPAQKQACLSPRTIWRVSAPRGLPKAVNERRGKPLNPSNCV